MGHTYHHLSHPETTSATCLSWTSTSTSPQLPDFKDCPRTLPPLASGCLGHPKSSSSGEATLINQGSSSPFPSAWCLEQLTCCRRTSFGLRTTYNTPANTTASPAQQLHPHSPPQNQPECKLQGRAVNQLLTAVSPVRRCKMFNWLSKAKFLVNSVGRFLWCKYSHYGQLQVTYMRSHCCIRQTHNTQYTQHQ
jgi:hypothetical protein